MFVMTQLHYISVHIYSNTYDITDQFKSRGLQII